MQKQNILRTVFSPLIMAVILVFGFSPLSAQNSDEDPANIWVFTYMKSKSNDYVAAEQELAKPFHTELVKRGHLVFWALYRVEFPTGTSAGYDYVTLQIYKDADQYANRWNEIEAVAKAVHPGKKISELTQRFAETRDIVNSEMFGRIDKSWTPPEGTAPTQYIVLNRMKVPPGGGGAYVEATTKIYKPFFKAAAEDGKMRNWWLLGRMMPRGTDYEHSFITLDVYQNLHQVMNPRERNEAWQKVHGDKTISEVIDGKRMVDLREMTSSDLLRRIDSTAGTVASSN